MTQTSVDYWSNLSSGLSQIVSELQQWAWFAGVLTISAAIAEVARRHIGMPWVWKAVHRILDVYSDQVFSSDKNEPIHHDRITLFKYQRFRWTFRRPFGGWLVPVERSGHTNQRRGTCFLAPDDADQAEGVAGRAWSCRRSVIIDGLPPISCNHGVPDPKQVTEYSRATGVSEKWIRDRVRRRRPFERAFCAIPVEVAGRRWGVLVLSSRSPEVFTENATSVFHEFVAKAIEPLLERA